MSSTGDDEDPVRGEKKETIKVNANCSLHSNKQLRAKTFHFAVAVLNELTRLMK